MKCIAITDTQVTQIAAAELNRCFFELAFLGALPGAQIVHKPEVTYVASGLPDVAMNKVCRTHTDDARVVQVIEDVFGYFKQDEMPFSWLIGPDSRPLELGRALKHHGLLYDHDEIGLIIDLTMQSMPKQRSEFTIKHCVGRDEVADFCYVQCLLGSGEAHHALWSRMPQVDWSELPLLELYVGYQNDEPVVAGIAVPYAGIMGLYAVGTLDGFQDYSGSFVQGLLGKARERGYLVAATNVEQRLVEHYRTLGFRPLCVYQVWIMQEYRQQYESLFL